jgi:5-deoxy-D-glucuronate isomerase
MSEKAVICDKRQSTFFHELEIPEGFHTWAVLRSFANARSVSSRTFVRNKSMSHVPFSGRA